MIKSLLDYIIFIIYKVLTLIINIIPKKYLLIFLKYLNKLVYTIDKRHYKVSLANLNFVYNDTISEEEKHNIIKKSYFNLLMNLYYFININKITLENLNDNIIIENEHYINDAIKNNKRIIITTAHYGVWELAIPFVSLKYNGISVISKAIKNKYLDSMLRDARKMHNIEMFEKKGSAKHIVKSLKNNRIVAIAIDQSVSIKDGIKINFLGKDASQTDSPVRIASKLDAIIIPFVFETLDTNSYKATFNEPIEIPKNLTTNDVEIFSQNIANIYEKQILKNPSQWFWQHKRFKEFHKEIYS